MRELQIDKRCRQLEVETLEERVCPPRRCDGVASQGPVQGAQPWQSGARERAAALTPTPCHLNPGSVTRKPETTICVSTCNFNQISKPVIIDTSLHFKHEESEPWVTSETKIGTFQGGDHPLTLCKAIIVRQQC